MLRGGSPSTAAQPTAGLPTAGDPGAGGAPAGQVDQMPEITNDDYVRGAENPTVTLVEYSDFNCPFCQRFQPTMQQVMEEYGDQVAWAKRHMPVLGSNRQAEAAECAGSLGGESAYWDFSSYYYDNITGTPGRGSDDQLEEAAVAVGLNADQFNECLNSGEFSDKVNAQMQGGQAAGVSGTPGTIVVTADGPQELIPGALPFEQVSEIIERYL